MVDIATCGSCRLQAAYQLPTVAATVGVVAVTKVVIAPVALGVCLYAMSVPSNLSREASPADIWKMSKHALVWQLPVSTCFAEKATEVRHQHE